MKVKEVEGREGERERGCYKTHSEREIHIHNESAAGAGPRPGARALPY